MAANTATSKIWMLRLIWLSHRPKVDPAIYIICGYVVVAEVNLESRGDRF
jgi:hypothetical protein